MNYGYKLDKEIALYIHIPFCISKCSYCDFFSIKKCICSDEYVDALCSEINYRIKTLGVKKIKTIYIGGGTPSLLSKSQLLKITEEIKKNVIICEDYEFTIEVNPDDVCDELLETFCEIGCNRISCGIQSMNEEVLKNVRRRAGREENLKALTKIKRNWKGFFSVDLISALPLETMDSFEKGLNEVISFKPDHISLYSLTIEESTPLGKLVNSGQIDYDFSFADDMWIFGRKMLEENGYNQYEVSNFAKKGFECRHNLVYWNHKNYIGVGSGGTGTFYNLNGTGFRWTNTCNIEKYIEYWENDFREKSNLPQEEEIVSIEDSVFEFFMMGLRKADGISSRDFLHSFGKELPEKFVCLAEKWNCKKMMEINKENDESTKYFLNKNGILFLNTFLRELEI